MNKTFKLCILVLFGLAFIWNSCTKPANSTTTASGLVNVTVSTINYPALNVVDGYIYVTPAMGPAGIHGIILFRASQSQFYALERTCTYTTVPFCAPVVVTNSFTVEDTCRGCKSTFSLPGNGSIIAGLAAQGLHQYTTSFDGVSTVTITN